MTVSDRTLRRLAWCVWWFFLAVVVVSNALIVAGRPAGAAATTGEVALSMVLLSFPLTGLLVLRAQPRNTIGWLLQGVGLVWGMGGLADNYARYGLVVDPGSLPGPEVAAALASVTWAPGLGLMGTFLILLYPDGRLPSRRWRPVAWLAAVTIAALTVTIGLAPGALSPGWDIEVGSGRTVRNPLGVAGAEGILDAAQAVLLPLLPVCIVASAVGLVRRFRRSRGVERQQLKWLAAAAGLVAGLFLVGVVGGLVAQTLGQPEPGWLVALRSVFLVSLALMPIAIGIAVLRHGLYSIDVVINRALVYGTLTATLAGVYLGSVLLLQLVLAPVTDQSDLAVAVSTLAVAGLFGPARARIQAGVDRRFYRSRYDAARTLESFTSRRRDEVDLASVSTDLRNVVRATVQPTHVSLWLRDAP
jgi:hypothetical protein